MKLTRLIAPCAALALAGGWYVGVGAPDRRFETALRSLRASDVEQVNYQLLAIEPSVGLQAQASLLRGWLMLMSKDRDDFLRTDAAIEELSDAVEDDDKDRALALALLGRARYENRQLREALNLLERSLELDPHEVEAHRWVGVVLYELGLYLPAIPHLEEVALREPSNGRLHRLLGIIHRERGEVLGDAFAFGAAVEAYQESLRRDPSPPDAQDVRLELARCFFYRNEWDEALDALRPCADTPDCLTLRAECYYSKGELARAVEYVDRALEQAPDNSHALSVKATLAMAKRDVPQAAALLERAVDAEPADYNLRYRLVQAYHHLGKEELAARHADEMETLLKLLEEQSELTRRALTETDAAMRFRLAELSERLDDHEMAKSWRKAAELLVSPTQRPGLQPPAP
ncbi:MAG TPA: tetratricopeptide repeat protein [Pirellulales bacterium]|nr:tetratricopeptide repeat protein [Pirellulales bacterium]